jgi:hypothetical protein
MEFPVARPWPAHHYQDAKAETRIQIKSPGFRNIALRLSGMTSSLSLPTKFIVTPDLGMPFSGILLIRHSYECQNPDSHIDAGLAPGKSSAFY